jgi:Ca2+-binding EF-hand superfamily protein
LHRFYGNDDRKLTVDELVHWRKARSKGERVDEAKVAKAFDLDDKNKDGVVEWQEFGGPKGATEDHYEYSLLHPDL